MKLKDYIFNIFVIFDETINTVFLFGLPDETISARCYRLRFDSKFWSKLMVFVDFGALTFFGVKYHCRLSYIYENRHRKISRHYRVKDWKNSGDKNG